MLSMLPLVTHLTPILTACLAIVLIYIYTTRSQTLNNSHQDASLDDKNSSLKDRQRPSDVDDSTLALSPAPLDILETATQPTIDPIATPTVDNANQTTAKDTECDDESEKSDAPAAVEYPPLEPGDYYMIDGGLMVFTEQYHLKRGTCCRNVCRHCPYGFKKKPQPDAQTSPACADIEDTLAHMGSQSTPDVPANDDSTNDDSEKSTEQQTPLHPHISDELRPFVNDSDPTYIDYARVKAKARAPPRMPLDNECCGTGCVRCVFDIYDTNLERWQKRRDAAVQEQIDEYNNLQLTNNPQ